MKKLLLLAVLGGFMGLIAADGASLYSKCAGCHGVNGERKALNKSEVIKGWDVSKAVAALMGYKNGTYGGPMKAMMQGQVKNLSEADIQALGEHIATFK